MSDSKSFNHIKCPFCVATPSVGYFYKHVLHQHIHEVFDKDTDYGKSNLAWLSRDTPRKSAYTLHLPKGQSKFCCLKCEKAFNRPTYADAHIKCLTECLEKHEELRGILKIEPVAAPFCDPPTHPENGAAIEYRERVYQRIIMNVISDVQTKNEDAYWFQELCKDESIYEEYKRLKYLNPMPSDEEYDPAKELKNDLKRINLPYQTIVENWNKKLPILPPQH
jgi:hypothetical protein